MAQYCQAYVKGVQNGRYFGGIQANMTTPTQWHIAGNTGSIQCVIEPAVDCNIQVGWIHRPPNYVWDSPNYWPHSQPISFYRNSARQVIYGGYHPFGTTKTYEIAYAEANNQHKGTVNNGVVTSKVSYPFNYELESLYHDAIPAREIAAKASTNNNWLSYLLAGQVTILAAGLLYMGASSATVQRFVANANTTALGLVGVPIALRTTAFQKWLSTQYFHIARVVAYVNQVEMFKKNWIYFPQNAGATEIFNKLIYHDVLTTHVKQLQAVVNLVTLQSYIAPIVAPVTMTLTKPWANMMRYPGLSYPEISMVRGRNATDTSWYIGLIQERDTDKSYCNITNAKLQRHYPSGLGFFRDTMNVAGTKYWQLEDWTISDTGLRVTPLMTVNKYPRRGWSSWVPCSKNWS